jgi:hypothetical protein
MRWRLRLLVGCLGLLTFVAIMLADEQLKDPPIYTVAAPDGWKTLKREESDETLKRALECSWMPGAVEAMIAPTKHGRFAASCQVVVQPRPRPQSIDDWKRAIVGSENPRIFTPSYAETGEYEYLLFREHRREWRHVLGRWMVVDDFKGTFSGAGGNRSIPVRGRHTAFFAGLNEVHLFCFAPADRYDEYAESFEHVLASFRGLTFGEWLAERARGVFIGVMALTALTALCLRMTRRTRGPAEAP